MSDVTGDYLAFRREAGAVWLPRDFVAVHGPDAVKFLQGQLSQQVEIGVGESAFALILQPQGKLAAFLRVLREADDRYVLETDAGYGDVVAERLNKFKLRIKADVEPLAWKCLAIRGPKAHDVVPGPAMVADWPGLPGADLVGEDPQVPDGVRLCELDAYESVRIEAGIPVMGRELDESTIPAEAGIVERSVSWTKGCYTGQELVARIDSRGGNVPRRLRGVVVAENVLPPPGARVLVGEKDVGRLTSVGESLDRRAPVALAYVGRAVEPPADVTVAWDGGTASARVEALPLVS
ncbi:MAG: YgfZ/GcvT domain-containing protein [Acidimicrobiales bacterium]